jgi:hypothetical protein
MTADGTFFGLVVGYDDGHHPWCWIVEWYIGIGLPKFPTQQNFSASELFPFMQYYLDYKKRNSP